MLTSATRPALRYHGGKWVLAPWIIEHFPLHRGYVEPFGGAASVLIQKPRVPHEVYNDLDGEVVNLFRVLRSPRRSAALRRACHLTPFARAEFSDAYEPTDDPVERARRMVVRSFMGFGNSGALGRRTGFRALSRESGTTPAQDWRGWPFEIAAIAERMRGVVIESEPALDVIARHDAPDVVFYVDPPYPTSTRGEHRYRHEMSDDDHRALAASLRQVRGHVLVSGYACELYDREMFADWRRVERESRADGGLARVEVLWLSPRTAAAIGGRQQHLVLT